MAKTDPFSIRFDPDLKAKLRRLADADRRSLTNYIELLLQRHVHEVERSSSPLKARRK